MSADPRGSPPALASGPLAGRRPGLPAAAAFGQISRIAARLGEATSRWLPWLILAFALAVRLSNLLYHSLWFDEVVSTQWAARSARTIWQVGMALSEDKHPPLYYLALHYWTRAFGPGDFAVRALGALIGALAVWPVYGLGTMLGKRRTGAIAALLLALNPYLVWYSQEARMFMPGAALVLAALYALLRGWRSAEGAALQPQASRLQSLAGPGLWFGAFVVAMTAALYTFLYTAFVLPVAGAWLLGLWWQGRGSHGNSGRLAIGMAALVLVGLLFLPFARVAWSVSGAEAVHGRAFEGMLPVLPALLRVYTVGWPNWPAPWPGVLTAGAAALALAGLLWPIRPSDRGTRWGGAWPALWLGTVLLCAGILLSRESKLFVETRYHIALVPALCLAWARALSGLWDWRRLAGWAGLALVTGVLVLALPWNWRPENRREDWRGAAAYVDTRAGAQDAVLVQADYVRIALERYLERPQALFYPFTDAVGDPAAIDPPLAGLAGYNAVWLVQSHHEQLDPGNLVAGWFAARFPEITEAYPHGIVIHGFQQKYRTAQLPAGVPRVDATLGQLRLLGCAYSPQTLPARDEQYHPPSNWIHATTYWTVDRPVTGEDLPAVRLVDGAGQVWGDRLDRPGDALHLWPPARWLPGEVVRADTDVNLNPVTPDGDYRLVVQLPGTPGEAQCGEVRITR